VLRQSFGAPGILASSGSRITPASDRLAEEILVSHTSSENVITTLKRPPKMLIKQDQPIFLIADQKPARDAFDRGLQQRFSRCRAALGVNHRSFVDSTLCLPDQMHYRSPRS
jgi:hypothetical protein